jgi:type IV pilus assembly protein PilY1
MRTQHFALTLALAGSLLGMRTATSEPAQVPIFLMSGSESLVMINLSNDHELFFKAYDDYSDVNGDGTVDTTYNNNIEYYGYFDSGKCYDYDSSAGRFEPAAEMTTKYYCNNVSGDWSGNFLNWATMTRMDAIRKVLYGGYRSTDSSSETVLERQFLPTDAHSFVKYYSDTSDIAKLTPYSGTDISICNTTPANSGNSKDVTNPPQMRVAQGNFSMWTAHEVRQCSWSQENNNSNNNDSSVTEIYASSTPPSRWATGSAEFLVRVEVCNATLPEANCRVYPSGNRKPIGLLQEHGEDGAVKFGLMTGSYQKNKSGGVLRKNVSDFRNEVEEDSTGQFTASPSGGGIVDTLDRLRLTRYDYGTRQYNALDSCTFGQFGFVDGECSNWGNPQSEIYLESLRYFGGLSATSAFAANDSGYINGLGTASWTDPLTSDNYCAPVNVIHFNASTSSFDGDQLGGFSALPGSPDASTETDKVGVGEGVTDAGEYFVGQITGDTDKSCSPKDLDALSDASGVCPEAPWLEGTYQIAGLAYYANQNSIRDDLDDIDGDTADVRIKTYGVALSPAQPVIEIPVPGSSDQEVILLPACMEFRNSPFRHNGNCAIVDFRVVRPHTVAGGVGTGKFMVLWESAQHGGDYDQDMGGVISYEIDASNITVTTQVYGASTGGIHGFGYVVSGTTQDGLHIHSGHNNFDDYEDPYGLRDCDDAPGGDCDSNDPASSITYTLGSTTAQRLETPLYYATKWGGFKEEADANDRPPNTDAPNQKPDQAYEWDKDLDGLPDNYFFARNPGELSGKLATVFETIDQVSSSASVVANSVSLQTTTRIYQARFDSTDWSGRLLSFPVNLATGELEAEEWDAGERIAAQNVTGSSWNSAGRTFITWDGSSGVAFTWDDNGTPLDLTDDTSPLTTLQRQLLNIDPDDGATVDGRGEDRLKYIRGDFSNELAEGGPFRNRSTPLGDVVHSTPTIVAAPNFGYRDKVPGTTTNFESAPYSGFKKKYQDSECFNVANDGSLTPITSWLAGSGGAAGSREPMVYFGANDGALHAVSACTGRERLAYVPETVFPNLNELTSTDYSHRYYVDGPPTVVDAFWSGSWHTVLLGTLGAGGKGVFALNVTDPNTFSEGNAANIVLWEKNPLDTGYGELGYTFSQPAVIKAEGHGWVAVFGNGYDSASGKAVLYIARIYDGALLQTIDLSAVNGTAHGSDNGLSTLSPIDTDGDGDVDLMYGGDLNGNVWRFAATTGVGFAAGTTTLLYTAMNADGDSQPITSRFAVGRHPTSAVGRILYFGTGKYYEIDDQDPDLAVTYNSMYGIWDRDTGGTVTSVTTRNSNILQRQTITLEQAGTFGSNSFDVRVVSDTPITWVTRNTSGYWNSCSATGSCGWYLDLESTGEKMVANPILRGGRLIFVTTIPSLVPCAAGGTGWLMEIDPNTGGRLNEAVFDLNGDGVFDYNDNLNTSNSGTPVYTPISGKKSKVGILQPPAILSGIGGAGDGSYGGREGKYSSGSRDAQIDVTIENPGLLGAGRKSWVRIK